MRIATITPVYNEEDFLPQFLAHYSPAVESVFLLDNESTDRSLEVAARFPNVEVETFRTGGELRDRIQHEAILARVARCQGRFDYVILVDADEFLFPKSGESLATALGRLGASDVVGTHGYQMFPGPDEGPYDPARPIAAQRRWGFPDREYSKPILVRPGAPFRYAIGRHRIFGVRRGNVVGGPRAFFLLHYAGVSEEIWVKRRLPGRIQRLSAENRAWGMGTQYWEGDEESLRREFREGCRNPRLGRVLPPRDPP